MAEGLMANKVDKSCLISDVDNYQRKIPVKYWNVINFPSIWWIQTKQVSKRWLGSFAFVLKLVRKL